MSVISVEPQRIDNYEPVYRLIRIVSGLLLISLGLPLVFLGHKAIKFLVFLAGMLFFGLAIYFLTKVFVNLDTCTHGQLVIVFAISVFTGMMGGVFSVCFMKLGSVIAGGFLGFFLGQSIIGTYTFQISTGDCFLIILFVFVFTILSFFFSDIILIFGTAAIGSYLYVGAIDLFARTGISEFVFKHKSLSYEQSTSAAIWSIIASGIFMFFIGLFVQLLVKGLIKVSWFTWLNGTLEEDSVVYAEKQVIASMGVSKESNSTSEHTIIVEESTQELPTAQITESHCTIIERPQIQTVDKPVSMSEAC